MWSVCEPPLVWRSWEADESLVYHVASGDTHLVNAMTTEVLRQLEAADRSTRDLAVLIGRSFDVPIDDELEQSVGQLLVHLERVGLVHSVR